LIKVKRLDGRQRYEDEKTRNEKDDEIAVFSRIHLKTSGKDSAQGLLPFLFDARRYECTIRLQLPQAGNLESYAVVPYCIPYATFQSRP